MKMHSMTNTQPWIVRTIALVLVAPMMACDDGSEPDDLAAQAGDEDEAEDEDEADDESEDDVEFRGYLPCLRPANPSPDVNTTLSGGVTSVTREGSGTGNGCDLFTVRVATPSGHRAREIVVGGSYAGPVDAIAFAWKRTCTDGSPNFPPLCTTWQNLTLDPLEVSGGCWGDVPQIGEEFCFGGVDGGGDIPANSYTDIVVG
ncbi:MAG: hypothetical protein IAG13_33620, partial [Deltaproteobacteria bacterium]|nr:hypothetical protein [Nannocystaceae bacterium]